MINNALQLSRILVSIYHGGSVVYWLGRWTCDLGVAGSRPGLIISEIGDGIWQENYLGCNHHLGQLSLASLRGR